MSMLSLGKSSMLTNVSAVSGHGVKASLSKFWYNAQCVPSSLTGSPSQQ